MSSLDVPGPEDFARLEADVAKLYSDVVRLKGSDAQHLDADTRRLGADARHLESQARRLGDDARARDNFTRLLGYISTISAESEALQVSLHDIQRRCQVAGTGQAPQALALAVREHSTAFDEGASKLNPMLDDAWALVNRDAQLASMWSGTISHIDAAWRSVAKLWPRDDATHADVDEILGRAPQLEELLHSIVFQCALVTIPAHVNQLTARFRVGHALNFNTYFEEEVPNPDDRTRVLHLLSGARDINGVVDAEREVIYCASASPWRRAASYLFILLTVLAGVGILILFTNTGRWFHVERWISTPGDLAPLLKAYAFVLLGGVVHIAVDGLKKAQERKGGWVGSAANWTLWVHVREQWIISDVLWLWLGVAGLVLLKTTDWETAFFIGYSIDSFSDLFLKRFDLSLGRRAQSLKRALA
ncbi:MAG TPA: hypothetical protein VID73_05525 [Ktedonobacterales bacterium]|jgi:hypothetical protein